MNDRSKCCILVPVGSCIEPETDDLLKVLANRGYDVRYLRGSSQVDLARSTMATQALRDGFEETFWIDSDISFDPDDVDRIRSHGLPICAGMYPCKGPKRMAGKLLDDRPITFGLGGGLVEVDMVGFGFVHVRNRVYHDIVNMGIATPCLGGYAGEGVIPFFRPMIHGGTYLSEDFTFCTRAKAAGFRIMVDSAVKLGHIGKKKYTWDDLLPDVAMASIQVQMKSTGAIEAVASTQQQPTGVQVMSTYRETLLNELASLEQQEAGCNEGIAKADAVKADNINRLNAIHGAKSMIQHLLKKLDDHQPSQAGKLLDAVEEIARSNNEEGVE